MVAPFEFDWLSDSKPMGQKFLASGSDCVFM
eukprot:SAG31_NODE_14407_length_808_cov_1.112835_1_plen_30_part_01